MFEQNIIIKNGYIFKIINEVLTEGTVYILVYDSIQDYEGDQHSDRITLNKSGTTGKKGVLNAINNY